MNLYPLMLDLTGRLAVVVGGGAVGIRKSAALLNAGARVRIVSRDTAQGSWENCEWITGPYRTELLDGASLVFAAAMPAINREVVADAKARGIWVNSADDPETGDFILPAIFSQGDLTIAVSTAGVSPQAAKNIRTKLKSQFDETWADWLDLLREIRPLVLSTIPQEETRRAVLKSLADLTWLDRYRAEGRDAVRTAMWQVVEEASGR